MTVLEAFSIAFDEAEEVVSDAKEAIPFSLKDALVVALDEGIANPKMTDAAKSAIKPNAGASDMASGLSFEGKTLEQHDAETHPDGYKGGRCSYRARLAEAMGGDIKKNRRLLGMKDNADDGGKSSAPKPTEPQKQDVNSTVEELASTPSEIPQAKSEMLPQAETIETPVGNITVETTVQKAATEVLKDKAKEGNPMATEMLKDIQGRQQEQGKEAPSSPKESAPPSSSEPSKEEGEEKDKEVPPASEEPPPDTPKATPDSPSKPAKEPSKAPVPKDDEFRVGANTYQIGDNIYRDVTGRSILGGMLQAFVAGLRGERLITQMDKLSGRWDLIKLSESGEKVRDGIASAYRNSVLEQYEAGIGQLDEAVRDVAKVELDNIRSMFEEGETAAATARAVNAFKKWQKEYFPDGLTIAEEVAPVDFSKLGPTHTDWKAPTVNIFAPISADERDTSYMETKRGQIEERLAKAGIGATITNAINGSGVVQFEIEREDDGTDKALKDILKAMEPDIGAKIIYTPDTTSGRSRMGTITINNPNVRDASLRRLLEDGEALAKAKKMRAPILAGETAEGRAIWLDLGEHGFLGGDTGAGKSERVRGMLAGAYFAKSPNELQVVMNAHANSGDYKHLDGDPHTTTIGKSIEEVANNLAGANAEWKRREQLFSSLGVQDLEEYNEKMEKEGTPEKKLPHILVMTDEVTNLLKQRPELAEEIRGIVTNGRKFGVSHFGITQDLMASNIPTDIKGNQRLGVQSQKKYASDAIFDVHDQSLGKLNPKGDIMYKDKQGNLVRLRGTYADKDSRERLRDANMGKEVAPPEAPPTSEPQKEPVAPPSQPQNEPKAEANEPESEEKPIKAKDMVIDISSREGILSSAKAKREQAIKEARERFQKHQDIDKFLKEKTAAVEEEAKAKALADSEFPVSEDENLEDGDADTGATEGEGLSAPAATPTEPAEEEEKPEEPTEEEKRQIEDKKKLDSLPPQYRDRAHGGTRRNSRGVVYGLSKKELGAVNDNIPDGWEIDTDNQLHKAAKNKAGEVFVKHPTNGSYGRILLNAKGGAYFKPSIMTTDPDFKGFVYNEETQKWARHPDAEKAYQELNRVKKEEPDNNKAIWEAYKKYHRTAYGCDEAPENVNLAIVAMAVSNAIRQVKAVAVAG